MKKKKTHIALIIILVLVSILAVTSLILINNDRFTTDVTSKYLQNLEEKSGFDFDCESISINTFKDISFNNIYVFNNNKVVASADSIHISTSFSDVLRFIFGFKTFDIDVEIINPYVNYDFNVAQSNTNAASNSSFSFDSLIKRINGSFKITNADFSLIFKDYILNTENFNLDFSLLNNLDFRDSSFSFDKLNIGYLENFIEVNKFKFKLEGQNISFIVDSINSNFLNFGLLNGEGSYINGLLHCDVLFDPIIGSYNNIGFNTSNLGFSLEYDFLSNNRYFNIYLNLPNLGIDYKDSQLTADYLSANCNITSGFNEFILSLKASSVSVSPDLYGFTELNLLNPGINLSYNLQGDNSVSLKTEISGFNTNKYVKSFNTDIELDFNFKDVKNLTDLSNYSNISLSVNRFKCDSISGDNSITVVSNNSNLFEASINLSNKLYGSVNYSLDDMQSDIRLYLSDFKPLDYKPLYNLLFKFSDIYVDNETSLNGNIIYRGSLNTKDVTGRASINLVGQNILFDNKRQGIAISFEAESINNQVNVNTLALSAFGKRLSYTGTIDISKINPEGSLILQDSSSFDELARIDFNLDGNNGYFFNASTVYLKDIGLDGHVNPIEDGYLNIDAEVLTKHITYPLLVSYYIDSTSLLIKSDDSNLYFELADNENVNLKIDLDSMPIYISDSLSLQAFGNVDAQYNLLNNDFYVNGNNINLIVSDILNSYFDIHVLKDNIALGDLSIVFKDKEYSFDGGLNISFDNIQNLIDFPSVNFDLILDLKNRDSNDYLFGSYIDGIYSIEANFEDGFDSSLSVLGTLDNGFYADCNFADIDFNAIYDGEKLQIVDGKGEFKSLSFEDIGFNFDLTERTLIGSLTVENYKQNFDAIVKQGGKVQILASLDSVVIGALNLAGIDAQASFSMSLIDAYLGDGFNIADTDVNVSFSRSLIQLEGDLINGYIEPLNRYLDIDIDEKLLFGLHAKGYYDDDFEIYLSDLYFPLQLIDQFLNTPFYTTYGGIIEGSLLVNGSLQNPSFYGMLYSQAFNMGLLYIPDQNLSLKNVVISAVDHSFIISETPVVGYSSLDGRYYNGTVSVDVKLGSLSLESLDLYLDVSKEPIDLWIPLILDEENSKELNIRGDVVGVLHFYYKNNQLGLDADITASNADVTFAIENKPDWMKHLHVVLDCDVLLTSGKNVEFYYPNRNNAFINFTVEEGETVDIIFKSSTKEVVATGEFDIKSGRISYINNDFNITEGKFRLDENLDGKFDFFVDLTSHIREYDYSGDRLDIYLTLNNANLNNINPRFSSIPSMTENEILQVLASNIIPSKNETVAIDNLANIALMTAKAASNLGIINTNSEYSLTGVIRDSLGLDVFAAKSAILENIIIDSLSAKPSKNSLLAKYLNGTTIFAGKYIGDDIFARMTLLLKSPEYNNRLNSFGHFLSSDLNIDFELSLEWENPIGEFSVFTKPHELSVLDFLDNIGFSVTKRYYF